MLYTQFVNQAVFILSIPQNHLAFYQPGNAKAPDGNAFHPESHMVLLKRVVGDQPRKVKQDHQDG